MQSHKMKSLDGVVEKLVILVSKNGWSLFLPVLKSTGNVVSIEISEKRCGCGDLFEMWKF